MSDLFSENAVYTPRFLSLTFFFVFWNEADVCCPRSRLAVAKIGTTVMFRWREVRVATPRVGVWKDYSKCCRHRKKDELGGVGAELRQRGGNVSNWKATSFEWLCDNHKAITSFWQYWKHFDEKKILKNAFPWFFLEGGVKVYIPGTLAIFYRRILLAIRKFDSFDSFYC